MSQWWTYGLSDFLLFSPRAYHRLFELHNDAVWPAPILMLVLGVGICGLVILKPPGHGRIVSVVLASIWLFVGWAFVFDRYASINWAITYVVPLFGLQAMLLMIVGAVRTAPTYALRRELPSVMGLAFLVFAVAAYPTLAPLQGRPWMAAEVFGIAPDPTALATLGLALIDRSRHRALLAPVPALWLLLSGLTLWTMRDAGAWVPFTAVLIWLLVLAWEAAVRRPARDDRGRASR